jgi:hypothetical protein
MGKNQEILGELSGNFTKKGNRSKSKKASTDVILNTSMLRDYLSSPKMLKKKYLSETTIDLLSAGWAEKTVSKYVPIT